MTCWIFAKLFSIEIFMYASKSRQYCSCISLREDFSLKKQTLFTLGWPLPDLLPSMPDSWLIYPCQTLAHPLPDPCLTLAWPFPNPCLTLGPPLAHPWPTLGPPLPRPYQTLASPLPNNPCPTLSYLAWPLIYHWFTLIDLINIVRVNRIHCCFFLSLKAH